MRATTTSKCYFLYVALLFPLKVLFSTFVLWAFSKLFVSRSNFPQGDDDHNYSSGHEVLKIEEHLLCGFDSHVCYLCLGLFQPVEKAGSATLTRVTKDDTGLPPFLQGVTVGMKGKGTAVGRTLFWRENVHVPPVSCSRSLSRHECPTEFLPQVFLEGFDSISGQRKLAFWPEPF